MLHPVYIDEQGEPYWCGHPLDPDAPLGPEVYPRCWCCGERWESVEPRRWRDTKGMDAEEASAVVMLCATCGAEPVEDKSCGSK